MTIDRLTPRQREVAELVAIGFPDKAIAGRLGCSVRTVENHVFSIGRALDCDHALSLRVQITRRILGVLPNVA